MLVTLYLVFKTFERQDINMRIKLINKVFEKPLWISYVVLHPFFLLLPFIYYMQFCLGKTAKPNLEKKGWTCVASALSAHLWHSCHNLYLYAALNYFFIKWKKTVETLEIINSTHTLSEWPFDTNHAFKNSYSPTFYCTRTLQKL